jgi:hypothetical protein
MLYKMAILIFYDDDFELSVMEVTRYAYKLVSRFPFFVLSIKKPNHIRAKLSPSSLHY